MPTKNNPPNTNISIATRNLFLVEIIKKVSINLRSSLKARLWPEFALRTSSKATTAFRLISAL